MQLKNITNKVTLQTVGIRRRKNVEGMPIETRELCNYRRKVTEKETYRKNREMKNAVRRIKNHSLEGKFLEWNNTFQRKKVITFLILLAARNIFL